MRSLAFEKRNYAKIQGLIQSINPFQSILDLMNFRIQLIMKIQIFFVGFLFCLVTSVYIPLKSERPRCLSQYLIAGNANTMKFQITFPKLNQVEPGEHFTVVIRNTETQGQSQHIYKPGDIMKTEEVIEKNVIYEICMMLKSDRSDLEALVHYQSESIFHYEHSEVKVPQTLLTKEHMKEAFLSAAYIASIIDEYKQEHKERALEQTNAFLQTERYNHRLSVLTGIELAAIVIAGLYQFYTLKNYLSSKQYV